MKSLKYKILFVFLTITAICNIAPGIIIFNFSRAELNKSSRVILQQTATSIAREVKNENDKEFKMLNTLASLPSIRSTEISLEEKYEAITQVRKSDPRYIDVTILDKDGYAIATTAGQKISFREREYYKEPMNGKKSFNTDPFINKVSNAMSIFYSVPVYDYSNKVVNVIFSVIDGYRWCDLVKKATVGKDSHPIIINRKKVTIVGAADRKMIDSNISAYDLLNSSSGTDRLADKIINEKTGIAYYSKDNVKKVVAWCAVEDTDWVVVTPAPVDDFQEGVKQMMFILTCTTLFMFILLSVASGVIVSHSIKPLKTVKNAVKEIASGNADLTKRITVKSKDEVGEVVEGFNQFSEKLQTIVCDIKKTRDFLSTAGSDLDKSTEETSTSITQILGNISNVTEQIKNQVAGVQETAGAVNQIASNILSLEKMIESQSAGVSQASAAVEEMLGNIGSVNQSVDKMAESFQALEAKALNGSSMQNDVNERIQQIENQSEMLQDANSAIANIAAQTNLLAMNAAIEAAHAGEAGKGFSVVADEIRKLSETSTSQSKTIGEQLNKIKDSIGEVVASSAESSRVFLSVSEQIQQTDQLVRQIKEAMTEQQEGSRQIGQSLHIMNDSTLEVKNASREMSAGNQAILDEIRNLQEATGQIQDSISIMAGSAAKIGEQSSSLGSITQKIGIAIKEIGKQIDLFKV